MKITCINFSNYKFNYIQNKSNNPLYKDELKKDIISFSSNTQKTEFLSEAKDIAKMSYGIYGRAKKIQKQGQSYIDSSKQIQAEAQKIQEKAKNDWNEIINSINYAKEFKVKASADPFKKTQTLFYINGDDSFSINEYKNDALTRRIEKNSKNLILFEYNKKGVLNRSVFDSNNGELIQYDENYKAPSQNSNLSDVRYIFKNQKLKRCDKGTLQNCKSYNAQESYRFQNEQLNKYTSNLHCNKNGFTTAQEEFHFSNLQVCLYRKNYQNKEGNHTLFDEEFSYKDDNVIYTKNLNWFHNSIFTADNILHYKNSKLKKAMIGISENFTSKIAEKTFIYDQNEKPQCCFLNHQFDFNNNANNKYDKVIYLI